MLQQIQAHPILFALSALGVLAVLVMYIVSRKIGGNAKSSDRARIMQCSFRPSPMAFFPDSITRMSDGMAMPVGTLRMTVGTAPLQKVPQSADVKLFVVDESKNVFEASKQLSVRQDGMIGIIDVPFPIKPYEKEFICRAWVVAAYYEDGDTWINDNAATYEARNKKFIARKLNQIK
ncbi:MAG: hypothetical protein FWH26_02015 [Oscillospiraceae bacterium]|nr:hypothetical protein [Oscillospiraceae bacterium]